MPPTSSCVATRVCSIGVLTASALVASSALAQAVSFDQAIALSQVTPRVEGRRRSLEARRAGDADLAGTSQGVSIQATPGMRILSEQDRGFEGQLSVVHSWNLGDLTGARQRAAHAERTVIAAEVRAAALEARLEAGRRWIDLWRLARLSRLAREEHALAADLVSLTERALRAGVGTSLDEAEAHAYAAEVHARLIAAEGTRHEAAVGLAVAMGRAPTARLRATGPLPSPSLPDDPTPWLNAIERMPSVTVERLSALAARAHEAEAVAAYAPVLGVGVQLQRESPSGFIANGVFTLSVPLMDQGQRQRSVARGEAERRAGEHGQARLAAGRELALAIHDVEHTRRTERALLAQLVPALVALVDRRDAALRAGESTVFQLLDARRRLLGARASAVEATGARAWAEVRLWLLLAEIERGREDAS